LSLKNIIAFLFVVKLFVLIVGGCGKKKINNIVGVVASVLVSPDMNR